MRILITGGKGYIGSSLFNELKQNYNVTLVTRQDYVSTLNAPYNLNFIGLRQNKINV